MWIIIFSISLIFPILSGFNEISRWEATISMILIILATVLF